MFDTKPRRAGQFLPGQSGNLRGRPRGARSKIGPALFKTLLEDFEKNGAEAIEKLRLDQPETYFKLIVFLLPQDAERTEVVTQPALRVIERRIVRAQD